MNRQERFLYSGAFIRVSQHPFWNSFWGLWAPSQACWTTTRRKTKSFNPMTRRAGDLSGVGAVLIALQGVGFHPVLAKHRYPSNTSNPRVQPLSNQEGEHYDFISEHHILWDAGVKEEWEKICEVIDSQLRPMSLKRLGEQNYRRLGFDISIFKGFDSWLVDSLASNLCIVTCVPCSTKLDLPEIWVVICPRRWKEECQNISHARICIYLYNIIFMCVYIIYTNSGSLTMIPHCTMSFLGVTLKLLPHQRSDTTSQGMW